MRRFATLVCLVCLPFLSGCDEVIGIARVIINAQLSRSGYDFTSDNGFSPIVIQNNTLDLAAPTSTGLGGSLGGPGSTSLSVTTQQDHDQPTSSFHYSSSDFFIWIRVP